MIFTYFIGWHRLASIGVLFFVNFLLRPETTNGLPCRTVLSTDKFTYEVGEIIHIKCNVTTIGPLDISRLHILRTDKLNGRETNISINNLSGNQALATVETARTTCSDMYQTYTCVYGDCHIHSGLAVKTIQVLEPVIVPPNFYCISNIYWNTTCFWGTSQTNIRISEWTLCYKDRFLSSITCCSGGFVIGNCSTPGLSSSCLLPTRLKQFHVYEAYYLTCTLQTTLSLTTPVRKYNYSYPVFANQSIVRLYAVDEVRVYTDTIQQLVVQMLVSEVITEGVVCLFELQSEDELYNLTRYIRQPTMRVDVLLEHLEAFTVYSIGISCRSKYSPYWSDSVLVHGRTLPELPLEAPTIIGVSESSTGTPGERRIHLYWKTVSNENLRGADVVYMVSILHDHSNTTEIFNADVITADVNRTLATNRDYQIIVSAKNEVGRSLNTSAIYISKTRAESRGWDVVLEQVHQGYRVVLFDDSNTTSIQNITHYYWCQGEYNVYPPVCKMPVKQTTLTYFMKEVYIPVGVAELRLAWYFGVGVSNSSNNAAVVQIVWSKCVFTKSSSPIASSQPLLISAERFSHNSSVVNITFLFNYCLLRSMPLVYQVAVVEAESCSWEQNVEDITNITASPRIKHTTHVVDRQKNVTVCLRAVYGDGDFDTSNEITIRSTNMMTKEAMLTDEKSTETAAVVGVVVAVLLCLTLASVLILKRCRTRLKDKYKIMDVLPSVSEINQQPIYFNQVKANEDTFDALKVQNDTAASTDKYLCESKDDTQDEGCVSVVVTKSTSDHEIRMISRIKSHTEATKTDVETNIRDTHPTKALDICTKTINNKRLEPCEDSTTNKHTQLGERDRNYPDIVKDNVEYETDSGCDTYIHVLDTISTSAVTLPHVEEDDEDYTLNSSNNNSSSGGSSCNSCSSGSTNAGYVGSTADTDITLNSDTNASHLYDDEIDSYTRVTDNQINTNTLDSYQKGTF